MSVISPDELCINFYRNARLIDSGRRGGINRGIKGILASIGEEGSCLFPATTTTLNRYAPRRVISIDCRGAEVGEEVVGRIECTADGIDSAGN